MTAARANGKVTWRNVYTNRYLEVYNSSKANNATVGTWPWNGSKTQYWYDSKRSQGYWKETNYNSGKVLTAYSTCVKGIRQLSWSTGDGGSGQSLQLWRERHISKTTGWELINRAGCDNDAYHDTLSQSFDFPNYYSVYLYPENTSVLDSSPGCQKSRLSDIPQLCLFK